MNPEEKLSEVVEVGEQINTLNKITPLSKYLAMFLFITLPFVGGWIGYTLSPEKVVEVEKVVITESTHTPPSNEVRFNADGIQVGYKDLFILDLPIQGATVTSPLHVSGKARGYWFFEATAPFSLIDSEGLVVGEGFIQAEGDWMTEELIPFSGILEFERGSTTPHFYDKRGVLFFENHNASGLPEHDYSYSLPVLIGK